MTSTAMTIAGSDPSAGAGLQADLKTFHQHGIYGTSIVTMVTVQNTQVVDEIKVLPSDFVAAQLDAVINDIPPLAAKTGALGNAPIVEIIADRSLNFSFPLVVDPIILSTQGKSLLDKDAVWALKKKLLPNAFLVTPNLLEASELAGMEVVDWTSMEKAAGIISGYGVKSVLVKGGHLEGDPTDLLFTDGRSQRLSGERFDTKHTHGTGCVLSAAITARLASGEDLSDAVLAAKQFVAATIKSNPGLGKGYGPVNFHVPVGTN